MYMYGYYGNGLNTFSWLLVFLVKFFILAFVVTLLIALAMAAKNYIFSSGDIASFKNVFNTNTFTKKHCTECGKVLENNWNVCPYCGAECNVANTKQKEAVYEQPLV